MAGEIERWITVNGTHIPIMKGQSTARAVGNFIRKKRIESKSKKLQDAIKRNSYQEKDELGRIVYDGVTEKGKAEIKKINEQKYRYYKGLFNRPR